jgi:signal transduction histidine kinase/CheY-like chemotaxis protein
MLSLLGDVPVAAAVFDLDGTLLASNAAFGRMFGAGDIAWRSVTSALAPRDHHTVDLELGGRLVRIVVAAREVAGRRIVVAAITELGARSAGGASTQRLESLGMVAGDLAHEFNNQLVSVIADASMLREEDGMSVAALEAVHRIESAARRMSRLSRQLLAFAGRGRFVTTLLDPDALLADSRDRWERLVRPGVQLKLDVGPTVVAIEADRGLLRQVFGDLIENASEAVADGGRVDVASTTIAVNGTPWWQLEVRDDGVGIDALTLSRIFEPFFSTKAQHRGLGLSAALGIVRRLGGDLSVESHPGQGSTFRVRLPIVPGAVAPRRRSTSDQPPVEKLTGLRVLVADDEATVRAAVQRMLERRGANAMLANDGEHAEQLLRSESFDVVLLDVMMPKRTGYQLVPIARQTQPKAAVILMSGYTDQAQGVEPHDAFLEKPFNASMLEGAIRGALQHHR